MFAHEKRRGGDKTANERYGDGGRRGHADEAGEAAADGVDPALFEAGANQADFKAREGANLTFLPFFTLLYWRPFTFESRFWIPVAMGLLTERLVTLLDTALPDGGFCARYGGDARRRPADRGW